MSPSKSPLIAVVDYGLGNLRSVSKALELTGAEVIVSSKPKDLLSASGVVFPGVGAFYRGMENLRERKLNSALFKIIKEGKPFLGICLGLQLLFTFSWEHGDTKGLDIIEGRVKRFEGNVKVPHMGWNQVKQTQDSSPKTKDLFQGIPDNSYFYFVHSYFVVPKDKSLIAATTEYGGEFTSCVCKENIFGVQFHPEKSGPLGLQILKNFIDIINDSQT
ncbi:MAG: imidazole glycerol phosphate synthase subunit HisH [Candidatus Omnitrophica bacterium]|nr:imidazole glycerol phosphate synthase subunit HisH [Candidatus Omnitrophota bacterium]